MMVARKTGGWPDTIGRYIDFLSETQAKLVTTRLLTVALLAAHAGTPSPTKTTSEQIDDFIGDLPKSTRRWARAIVDEFYASTT